MTDLLKLAELCEVLARGPFPKATILMGIVALGWVVVPAAWDGRLLSFGSTTLSPFGSSQQAVSPAPPHQSLSQGEVR